MMIELLQTLWFLLPAALANMAPVIANHIRFLAPLGMPVDGGKTFRGRRILGDNKTVRGFVAGVLIGLIGGLIQYLAASFPLFAQIALIEYSDISIALGSGAALGFGALAGDSIKSFFKRQLGIRSGKSWPVFDQVDSVIGALLIGMFFAPLTFFHFVIAIIIFGFGSFVVSALGVALKIKKEL